MSGFGHPESADLTGFTADYVIQQMAGLQVRRAQGLRAHERHREGAVRSGDARGGRVVRVAAARKWSRVVEAAMVPKTFVGQGRMRFVDPKQTGMEPIGNRIITLPEDQERARLRDPKSGFVSYVPPGSLSKGKALVENGGGGKTVAVQHLPRRRTEGSGNVPRLAGVHPIYLARQLYLFKEGDRNGPDAPLMKRPVAKLTDEDILNISAYVGSLPP